MMQGLIVMTGVMLFLATINLVAAFLEDANEKDEGD